MKTYAPSYPITRTIAWALSNAKVSGGAGISIPAIILSSSTVLESAALATVVGTLSVVNGTGTYSFTLTDSASGKFVLGGTNNSSLRTNATLDYDTAPSHSITVTATNGVTPIAPTAFIINVTNVLEVTLSALTLNTSTIMTGVPENTLVGTLQSVSAGSTLTMTDTAGGRFKLSGNTVVAGATATTSLVSHNITVRETHVDGNNSPRDSVIAITVIPLVVVPDAPELAMALTWTSADATPDYTIIIDDTITAGDTLRLQTQLLGGDWSSLVADITHVITVPENTAKQIDLGLGSLSNADYQSRSAVQNAVGLSAWSNIVPFTIAAVVTSHGLMWGTDAIMWGAEYQTWETPPFTPASLSPALWIEVGKGGLFQTITATTPAMADNDVVGTLPDWSGNSFTLTASANDTTRPTLQGVGTFPCLRFDGVNDLLRRQVALGMYAAGSCSIFVAVKSNGNATAARLTVDANQAGGNTWYGPAANTTTASTMSMSYRNDAGVQTLNFTTPALLNAFDGTDNVVGMTDDGSTISMYLDQGSAVTVGYARQTAVLMDQFNLAGMYRGGGGSIGGWWKGDIYGVVIVNGTVLSAGQRADLVTYLAALQGRTI